MEHESKAVGAEHERHEHANLEHAHHKEADASEAHVHHKHEYQDKNAVYAVVAAFIIGLVLIGITVNNGNYFYAGVVASALVIAVMLYYKRYTAATLFTVLVIIAITIAYRIMLLHFFGFYEPDGFYHFAVIRAAVLHGFVVPTHLSISGWPQAAVVAEPVGFYWITLIPYIFLQFFGISYYNIIRLVPVAFAIFDLIGTYFLIREFNKDKVFGILGMLFVGLSMGDAARTSATVYRGDGFVTLFVILGLLFMIRAFKAEGRNKILAYTLLTGFILSIGNLVWNGASFGIATYIFALVLILLYSFVKGDAETISRSRYLLLALAVWYLLSSLYGALNLIGGQNEAFTGIYFLVMFALLVIGTELALYLLQNKERFGIYVKSRSKRLTTFVVFAAAAALLIYFLAPQIVFSIFVGNGFGTNVAFAASIEELQAPSPAFLFASFGATMFMSPMSIMLYLSSYYTDIVDLFWVAVLALSVMYMFMEFDGVDGKTFLGGKAVIKFKMNEALIVFIAYYAITAYLQMHAVRFNSLLSIPLAIFTAYTIYWVLLRQKEFRLDSLLILMAFSGIVLSFIVPSILPAGFYTYLQMNTFAFTWILSILLVIFIMYIAYLALLNQKVSKNRTIIMFTALVAIILSLVLTNAIPGSVYALPVVVVTLLIGIGLYLLKRSTVCLITGIVMLAVLIGYIMLLDTSYSSTLIQADNINPTFISALGWIHNNTAPNSVILTLWPDGSLVEGVANRTSVTDSVGSQNRSKADPFAAWVFNTSTDGNFLTGRINGKPNYLLVRYTWLLETSGIYTEAQFNASNYNQSVVARMIKQFNKTSASQLNPAKTAYVNNQIQQLYAYNLFDQFRENVNATIQNYSFYSSAQGYEARISIVPVNGTQKVTSFLIVQNQYVSPFKSVVFYNIDDASYQVLGNNPYNATNNQTLVVEYSSIPHPGAYVNITTVYMFNQGMANSNMFKFLFTCGKASCNWDNNVASLQLAYVNQDTKLFKIVYNTTNTAS